ncbi:hypothetical protein JRQ81_017108, partial [Phrynocephalus forsythii]
NAPGAESQAAAASPLARECRAPGASVDLDGPERLGALPDRGRRWSGAPSSSSAAFLPSSSSPAASPAAACAVDPGGFRLATSLRSFPALDGTGAPFRPVHQLPFLNGQWMFGAHSPVIGFSPSSNVEFVPLLPHVYTTTAPHHSGKSWIEKRLPNCKIYLNNTFALDSAWIHPEELRIYQGHEKPLVTTNQVAVALSRPATTHRPVPAVVLTPQPIPGGCLKQAGSNQTIAFAAAMLSVDADSRRGPSTNAQPCHVLTLSPIKIPLLTAPFQ